MKMVGSSLLVALAMSKYCISRYIHGASNRFLLPFKHCLIPSSQVNKAPIGLLLV